MSELLQPIAFLIWITPQSHTHFGKKNPLKIGLQFWAIWNVFRTTKLICIKQASDNYPSLLIGLLTLSDTPPTKQEHEVISG